MPQIWLVPKIARLHALHLWLHKGLYFPNAQATMEAHDDFDSHSSVETIAVLAPHQSNNEQRADDDNVSVASWCVPTPVPLSPGNTASVTQIDIVDYEIPPPPPMPESLRVQRASAQTAATREVLPPGPKTRRRVRIAECHDFIDEADRLLIGEEEHSCGVCLDQATSVWQCASSSHTFCLDCMKAYLAGKLAEHETEFACAAFQCKHPISDASLAKILDCTQLNNVIKYRRLKSDVNLKECPACQELCSKPTVGLQTHCESCNTNFCFVHGTPAVVRPFMMWRLLY
jgi:hypothetical protein